MIRPPAPLSIRSRCPEKILRRREAGAEIAPREKGLAPAAALPIYAVRRNRTCLGSVDGFDQDEAAGKRNERGVVLGSFFAPECNALETLELAHGLLDPSAALIEGLWEERWAIFGIGAARDDRADVPLPRSLTVWLCVVPFVGQRRPGRDVRADIEQDFELPAVAGFAPSQVDGKGQAVKVGLEVDLGREPAARATECLAMLPPLAPAAETCARTTVLSNI